MGTAFRVWQIDRYASDLVEPGLEETRRACIYGQELDLDQSGYELGALLEDVGLANPFEAEELSVSEVQKMAAKLQQLTWEELERLSATDDFSLPDEDYCRPHYEDFRDMVLEAARLGNTLGVEAQ